jgi:uncharacterized protein
MAAPVDIPYQHPVVRDLAWVMAAPGLLHSAPAGQVLVDDAWCRQIYVTHEQQLRELDENPAPLLHVLAQSKSHRLGIYFEWLLRYWLEDILCVKQLQHNLPVFQLQTGGGRQTLGEFDFLFRHDVLKPLQHWEATVKFYLQKMDADGKPCWIGPADRDRLDIKLQRLFQHQLKLANLAEAQEYLSVMQTARVQAAAFIKGYLFYPLDDAGRFLPQHCEAVDLAPCTLSGNHQQGWWLQWRKMPVPVTAADVRWMVLPKSRWLAPVRHSQSDAVLLDEASLTTYCEGHFNYQRQPLLLAELQWQHDAWREVSRGFVLAPQ